MVSVLNEIAEIYNLPVIVSTHPRTRQRVEAVGVKFHKNIQFVSKKFSKIGKNVVNKYSKMMSWLLSFKHFQEAKIHICK